MQFDVNNRYLVSYGKEFVNFIPLNKKDVFRSYLINKKRLSRIINLQFVSQDNENFRCELACQEKDRKFIKFWQIDQDKQSIDEDRSISYLADESDQKSLKISISSDFDSMIFLSCIEKYSYSKESSGNFCQRVLTSLKTKQIDYVHNESNHFFLVCSRHYDKSIKILNNKDPGFMIKIPRKIEPHCQKIFDIG